LPYYVKFASDAQEFRAALRLRYEVFNLEMHEGLQSSHSTGYDFDPFDAVAEHIVVKCAYSRRVVGTYRVQTGSTAARNLGYYSEQEFDLAPFEPLRHETLELGRACIHREHRNGTVLMLLWKAIAQYGAQRGCRYLIGCSSLNSQDAVVGHAAYLKLSKYLAARQLQTTVRPGYACEPGLAEPAEDVRIPKLLRAYLSIGAKICGPPALDRQFGTIDFLTLLDLASMPKGLFARTMHEV
jgi:putative hemolysin